MQKKGRFVIIFIMAISLIATYLLLTREERAVKRGINRFIQATVERDFDTIYRYHAPTQKRIAIAMKSTTDLEARMKVIYEEQKASFEQAQPPQGRDPRPQWSEKFLFIKDMKYKIADIKMVEDRENPSLPIRERINGLVEIEVEYTNKETAPDLGGKVKRATYLIKMVHSRNVART
ncbi:MAG: hypothetical protein HY878_02355, partial [Deltaproteobacteria bacterium]|nr:hypothetical protein [Deltaproteobacteria bacterium]